jgi:hypothetical protein
MRLLRNHTTWVSLRRLIHFENFPKTENPQPCVTCHLKNKLPVFHQKRP